MREPTHFYLRAVDGRLGRDPKTRAPLSEKGERKPRNTYWIRRLRSGDVVEIKDPHMTVELPTMTVEEPRTDG